MAATRTGDQGKQGFVKRILPEGRESPTASAQGKAIVTASEPIRDEVLGGLEAELDRLLFRVMAIGGMPDVEGQLRLCRRLLILGSPR